MTRQTGGACTCEFTDRVAAEQVASDYVATAAASSAAKEEANKKIEEHTQRVLAATEAVQRANANREAEAAAKEQERLRAEAAEAKKQANAAEAVQRANAARNEAKKVAAQQAAAMNLAKAEQFEQPNLIENYNTSEGLAQRMSEEQTAVDTIKTILKRFYDRDTSIKNETEYKKRIQSVIKYYREQSKYENLIMNDIINKYTDVFSNSKIKKPILTTALSIASDTQGKVNLIIQALNSILADKEAQKGGTRRLRRSRPIQRTRRNHTRTHRVGKRSSKRSTKRV
jgi:hypothetical protein